MVIEVKQLSDLKPAPYNPRTSTAKQETHLKASLEKFGVVEPIVFNKQTGYTVGGHFRIRELKKLGYKEIECVIVDLNEADEKELNIRLNANTGAWDWDALANEWEAEDLTEWGLDIPNYSLGIAENTMDEEDIDIEQEFDAVGNSAGQQRVVFVFDGPEEAESYLNRFPELPLKKMNMAWQINLTTTQSI